MRKKIVIGVAVYSIVFILSGAYIILTIESARSKLDTLIQLHQVEILREHYLIQIKRVQGDLLRKERGIAWSSDETLSHVMTMGGVIETCFECHHEAPVLARLQDLKNQTTEYENALSRVLTMRANADRLAVEERNAFLIGDELTKRVTNMIAMTSVKLGERTQTALNEIGRTKNILYALMALVPLSTGIFVLLFLRSMTNPMHALLESTRRLKSGDLDYRISGLKDEFGELAFSFNEMAAALKEHMEKMQRTEQMVVAAELAAGLAHEVKNPLAGIKVAMSVLSEEASLSGEDKEVLRKVVGEVGRLEALMKSYLNFTRPPKPQPEAVNLNNLLNTTLAFYLKHHSASSGANDRIRIVKETEPVPLTKADPMQLQQVFLNIVLNAIHAMPRGGELTIRTAYDPERGIIRVAISDTGKGIDEAVIGRIFQPFFTTKAKGTGLGLAISKQLVEQHGGTISAANNPGGGSTFTIGLPVIAVDEVRPA